MAPNRHLPRHPNWSNRPTTRRRPIQRPHNHPRVRTHPPRNHHRSTLTGFRMSGFKGKYHRQHLCSRFTKDLVRRSRSRCECCNRSGAKLDIFEIEPLPEEPSPDHALFLCESCIKQIQHPKKMNPHDWRCLHETLWSELPALQVLTIRLLRRLANRNETWACELLEQHILDPDIEEWSNQAN